MPFERQRRHFLEILMMENQHHEKLLNGWKEISHYLMRGVRTVQRWEIELGLPIHRPQGKSRSAVLAFASELDEWLAHTPTVVTAANDTDTSSSPCDVTVLVVEDSVNDLNICVSVLRKLEVAQVDAVSNVSGALLHLEQVVDGKRPKPDVIVLDLHFSVDSGFEILRYWKARPALRNIQIIVWTVMPESFRPLSALYGIKTVIPKWAGAAELEAAFAELTSNIQSRRVHPPLVAGQESC
jgi:CheY-like chemotaxis protein